mgnify:CR=1 FL=1
MDLYLAGKTAVVTGASQGLGRAIARTLAEEGVKVFATARNASLLEKLKHEFASAGLPEPVTFIQDLLAPEAPEAIADAAMHSLGRVDILVNNAGASCPLEPVAPDEVWEEAMNLGFTRQRQLTQRLLPHFIDNEAGSILNITGTTEPTQVNASAVAKAAVAVWSKGLSEQLGQYGITINCLQPGLLDTAQIRRLFPGEARYEFANHEIALKDFGQAQDVANMATFLVSPRASYITGTVAVVDGGMRSWSF